MFKFGSSKRLSSSDFTMVTPPQGEPGTKENLKPTMSKSFGQTLQKPAAQQPTEQEAFDKLLDDLQIPSTLRPKLTSMDSTVKAAMLKSSQALVMSPPVSAPASPPATPRTLRRAQSIDSIDSPHASPSFRPPVAPFANSVYLPAASTSTLRLPNTQHQRGSSFDVSRPPPSQGGPKTVTAAAVKDIKPAKFFSLLSGTSSTQLDVEHVKKLRLLLRNESASWSQEFLRLGGYSALLTRLNEILEVEWREEQHDDQVLHELLRCLKALSTSSIGCFALRSSCPTPFVQLVSLLYSDKKPGDVATRQLIVDILLILFDLYPNNSLPSPVRSRPIRREAWEPALIEAAPSSLVQLPSPHKTFYSLFRAILLTPAPAPAESPASPISPHAFIESLHQPRIFKTYLQELSDVCRDYFWCFCHQSQVIWNLNDVDEDKVEKPRAPGGMTGGVEFEAMAYLTSHLKLINAMAKAALDLDLPKEHEQSAFRFHTDLFLSGLERILLVARKASTAYYPTLHLEISRYIALVGRARYELPWTVSRLIGAPPTAMCKTGRGQQPQGPSAATPVKSSSAATTNGQFVGAPALPSPRRIEPIRFDE